MNLYHDDNNDIQDLNDKTIKEELEECSLTNSKINLRIETTSTKLTNNDDDNDDGHDDDDDDTDTDNDSSYSFEDDEEISSSEDEKPLSKVKDDLKNIQKRKSIKPNDEIVKNEKPKIRKKSQTDSNKDKGKKVYKKIEQKTPCHMCGKLYTNYNMQFHLNMHNGKLTRILKIKKSRKNQITYNFFFFY